MEYEMMVNFSFIKKVRVVVGTFVKSNGSEYKQQIVLLQNIFYDSSAILIIKHNMLLSCRSSLCYIKYLETLVTRIIQSLYYALLY